MNKKIANKNKICTKCDKLILVQSVYFHIQENKNFLNLCYTCGFNFKLNKLTEISNFIKDNFSC